MTNDPTELVAAPRLPVPRVALWLLALSPFLLLFGFLTMMGTSPATFDLAKTPTMVGTVMFSVGMLSLMSAVILLGVRSIAQQQVDLLLRAGRDD